MTSFEQGDSADFLAQFYEYSGGPAANVTSLTFSVTTIGGTAILAATSAGITNITTGLYAYTWTVPAAQAVGDYIALWQATEGSASEIFTVTAAVVESESPGSSTAASVWYCTREDVRSETDSKSTARDNARIDRAVEASSRSVDALCHRTFWPETLTRVFDWPDRDGAESCRLWLDQHDLASATAITSGGETVAATDYFLRPDDGPPYTHVEIDLASTAAWGGGDTHQRDVSITGVWAYNTDESTATTTTAAVTTTTATTVDVADSGAVGVGSILRINNERMIVTAKTMVDTTVNVDAADSLTASAADVSITVSTLTNAPIVGETILVDSERMLVVDLAGSVLTVKRAHDGSVLAAHSASADIYAPRRCTVTRGALGTTAATHTSGATVYTHRVPPLIRALCVAEAVAQLQQGSAGWATQVGSGDDTGGTKKVTPGAGLPALRRQVYNAYARKARKRAI